MTREEKEMWNNIEKLSELRSKYSCFDKEEEPFYHALSLGIKGIKALKQTDVLDKIRAEIMQLRNFRAEDYDLEQYCDWFGARIIFRDDVINIIDKYRKVEE